MGIEHGILRKISSLLRPRRKCPDGLPREQASGIKSLWLPFIIFSQ
jgi:hypothetical protein